MNPMKMNISVMQQQYVITLSARRRGVLGLIHPDILFRERGRTFQLTMGKINLIISG